MRFLPEFGIDVSTIVFCCFAFFALIQLIFTILIYGRIAFHKQKETNHHNEGVSIIIAARNESKNLFKNLPHILSQDYPDFEVIVVNHQSIDDSQYILDAYIREYPNLRVIEVKKSTHLKYGKKLPLTIAIKGAKYDKLLFTDADCIPASSNWLSKMTAQFSDKKEIILGYAPYSKTKGFLNAIIRFDTAWIALNYFSFAKSRLPYMGVGRNLAYTRKAFNKVSGFKSHYSLSSGDDDLFIQDAAKKNNYSITIDPETYCYSKAPESWNEWFNQKSRHYTTTPKYRVIKKLMLGIYPLTLLLMLGTFVSLLFNIDFILIATSVFLFLLTIKWIIIGMAFKKLNENKFIIWIPLLDIFYAILAPIMYYSVDKSDTKKW